MPTTSSRSRSIQRSRWFMPAFSIALGLVMLSAFWAGGSPGEGAGALAVMVLAALVFAIGARRSETISGLGGPGRDERWERIDLSANALTGMVLITVVLGAWLWEVASGRDGEPYTQLAALAGVTYVVAVVVLRRRS
jgi:hypothetical protein